MLKVLITGSNGFVGQYLDNYLKVQNRYSIICASRRPRSHKQSIVLDLASEFDVTPDLADIDVVVHCAARVHLMQDDASDPLAEYRRVNTQGTLKLARQAADAGVKRFIFLSTIKVNGEASEIDRPFTPELARAPLDPYGLSKYEAEQGLLELAQETGMEVVIIRPPLVYGPGVKANFASMMSIVSKGIPLPFGAIHNQRSMVYVGNLASLIELCLTHPEAADRVFLVSDDEDVSTTSLLKAMAAAMNRPSRLLPVPEKWLLAITKWLGKPGIGERLCGSLQVDISETKSCLGWRPPYRLGDALKQTVQKAR